MSLTLRGVSHRYGAEPALDSANLDVADGEIMCLFGPSGCGKTTLLRVAAGLETLQYGEVLIDGAVVARPGASAPPERRPVGFVFQDLVLFPHLTVLENVAFGLRGHSSMDRDAQARGEIARVGLEGFEKRYPHQLSGGQQQRVALARALARRPRAMLLDEPFASVDAARRRALRDETRRILKDHQSTAVLVTHDAEEAFAMGDRIAVMARGRIIEVATPKALFDEPKTAAGAMLVGGAQSLRGVGKGSAIETAFGRAPLSGEGKMTLVIQPGGVEARTEAGGVATAIDCRFAGPGWAVTLAAPGTSELLTAPSAAPVALGARMAAHFVAGRLKAFAAVDG